MNHSTKAIYHLHSFSKFVWSIHLLFSIHHFTDHAWLLTHFQISSAIYHLSDNLMTETEHFMAFLHLGFKGLFLSPNQILCVLVSLFFLYWITWVLYWWQLFISALLLLFWITHFMFPVLCHLLAFIFNLFAVDKFTDNVNTNTVKIATG